MTYFPLVIVDDRRYFKDASYGEQEGAVTLRTIDAAVEWLSQVSPDDIIGELWLDHDLGKNDAGEKTDVRPFVLLLEEKLFFDSAPEIHKVWVHTSNSVGRKYIEDALSRKLPFVKRINADEYMGNLPLAPGQDDED